MKNEEEEKLELLHGTSQEFKVGDKVSRAAVLHHILKWAGYTTIGSVFEESGLADLVFRGEDGKYYHVDWDVVLNEIDEGQAMEKMGGDEEEDAE
jgi:hypothetical protein